MPKCLTVWITVKCGKFWNRWKYKTTWIASWETCMQVRRQQLELDFWTVVLGKNLECPLDCKEIQLVILKEISPECSLEELMLKLKLQYLATWSKELTHLKRTLCWERLRAGGEGDDRGWDGWMASPTQETWICVDSRLVMDKEALCAAVHGLTRVEHDWAT